MHTFLRDALLAASLSIATAFAAPPLLPQEIQLAMPQATLSGQASLRYWGFAIYDASLWVQPGFRATEFERHGFALQLHYQRDFSNNSVTHRSIEEMRRQPGVSEAQLSRWRAQLLDAFPDIRTGDRITGIHLPGEGAAFFSNGRSTGAIRDPEFARVFFGIWLSPHTSEPRLRDALVARAAAP